MAESKVAMMNEEFTSEEESAHGSSCLSHQYSSSPFKGSSSTSNDCDEEGSQCSIAPYWNESEQESGYEAESGASSYGKNRLEEQLLNSEW